MKTLNLKLTAKDWKKIRNHPTWYDKESGCTIFPSVKELMKYLKKKEK
jgi:hypothetical protein